MERLRRVLERDFASAPARGKPSGTIQEELHHVATSRKEHARWGLATCARGTRTPCTNAKQVSLRDMAEVRAGWPLVNRASAREGGRAGERGRSRTDYLHPEGNDQATAEWIHEWMSLERETQHDVGGRSFVQSVSGPRQILDVFLPSSPWAILHFLFPFGCPYLSLLIVRFSRFVQAARHFFWNMVECGPHEVAVDLRYEHFLD